MMDGIKRNVGIWSGKYTKYTQTQFLFILHWENKGFASKMIAMFVKPSYYTIKLLKTIKSPVWNIYKDILA